MSIVYIEGSQEVLYFFLVLVNSAQPDEMPHYAAFHLGLLLKSAPLGVSGFKKVYYYNQFTDSTVFKNGIIWVQQGTS